MSINKITDYTKVCLPCVDKKLWEKFQRATWNAGYEVQTIRTTYDQQAHKEATMLWGSDNYIAFCLAPNGEALSLKKGIEMFEGIKDKLVTEGKSKPVRKVKKNVQRLRKTKRPIQVDAVEDSPVETKVKNQ